MPIRIASQPVGAPILAATSTAVAQANERRGAMQARMFQDEQRRKAIQEERQADREFTLERDKIAAAEAEKRRLADVAEFDRRDAAYRRKDALGAMYDEVARREKFYSSTPLTPEGMKQRDEAAASLRYIRERQAAGDRPEIIQQYMAQWIAEFDNRNPSAWEDKPKPTIDEFSRNSMYAGPDGRIIPNDSVLSGGAVPGYSRTMDPSTGKWGPWEKWAGAGGVDDKEAGTKLKWAQDQVNKWISENDMGAGVNQEAYDKMLREQLNEYDRLQAMVRSGAYKDGQPGQTAPQQPGQPQPAPQQAAVPGDGQALPVPVAPFQPPTQPLNAGEFVLPGGPSQLAPPPRDYAAEVAAQQAQYHGGQAPVAPPTQQPPTEQQQLGPQQITDTLDRARAMDPSNAAMYDEAKSLMEKLRTNSQDYSPKEQEEMLNKIYQATLRYEAAGLGMKG